MTLAALPYVSIIWIHSWSLTTGVPHAPERGSLLTIALVLFSWIGLAALTLELPAPKQIDVLE